MRHGETVAQFERVFAAYVNARYAIAMTNGTATLEVALRALSVGPGDQVATTPLTMAATSMAILNVGAVPVYHDVDPRTWLLEDGLGYVMHMPVSLYGLHARGPNLATIDDAAQTLRSHSEFHSFTSYSLQRSKVLNTGEGGVLVTDNEELATVARSIASLGYDLSPTQSRIDSHAIKSPTAIRHVRYPSQNARMNDATAALGLAQLAQADTLKANRRACAAMYREAISGCDWVTPQYVPDGWTHDYWCYTVALADPALWHPLADAMVAHGSEHPYGAWRLTYHEPAFRHLAPDGTCPVAEDLQPRLVQLQTNDRASAARNAEALRAALLAVGGTR